MSEQAIEASIAEAEAVATLHALNAEKLRAFLESDVEWHREHLSDDFVCTLADGRRIGKDEFLFKTREESRVTDVTYDEIDVRPLGDVALVHGVTHWTREGVLRSTRYTDIWRLSGGRWLVAAAHLTRVATG